MRLWTVYGLGMPFVVSARSKEHAELVVVQQLYPVDPTTLWIIPNECAIAG